MRAFAIAFAVFLLFLAGATSVMYLASRHAVREAVVRELASAAASSASALSVPAERGAADPELQDMVWRVRESNRLDRALLLDRDGKVVASSSGAIRGGTASVFEASPRQVARVTGDARPRTESFQLLGEQYLRIYQPVMKEEEVWGVLCLDAHDPSPHGLSVLNWPFRVGLAVSALSALALAAMGVGVMRFLERRKREMLRVERLVTAGALSASMAHEVKNPMGIILSAAQLLERSGDLTEEGRDLTSTIAEEVRRVESQLDAFLDMSMKTSGRFWREPWIWSPRGRPGTASPWRGIWEQIPCRSASTDGRCVRPW
jgi:signal transduction histidine kinase